MNWSETSILTCERADVAVKILVITGVLIHTIYFQLSFWVKFSFELFVFNSVWNECYGFNGLETLETLNPGFALALFDLASHGVPLISAAYYNHTTMGGTENVHD